MMPIVGHVSDNEMRLFLSWLAGCYCLSYITTTAAKGRVIISKNSILYSGKILLFDLMDVMQLPGICKDHHKHKKTSQHNSCCQGGQKWAFGTILFSTYIGIY